MKDAKDLADIYVKQGFTEVEAKSGMHHGTYKVYVNYLPVADITQVGDEILVIFYPFFIFYIDLLHNCKIQKV